MMRVGNGIRSFSKTVKTFIIELYVEKITRQNRVKEALGKIYDNYPPYFREYLRRFKEDPTSRVFAPLAEAYRRLGRVEEAIEIALEGLEHHPDFHGGRVTLAKCYIDKKKYSEAKGSLEMVVKFAPENLLAQRLLGDVYVAMGDRDRALHSYKMASILSPNDVSLSQKIHALERGDTISAATNPSALPHVPDEEWDPALEVEANESSTATSHSSDIARDDSAPVGETSKETVAATDSTASEVSTLDGLLGVKEDDEEAFKTEHVSKVFATEKKQGKQEITTETLGDLYFSQGQYDHALRIFDRLADKNTSKELVRKINLCRLKLGVDKEAVVRSRQIDTLRALLGQVRNNKNN